MECEWDFGCLKAMVTDEYDNENGSCVCIKHLSWISHIGGGEMARLTDVCLVVLHITFCIFCIRSMVCFLPQKMQETSRTIRS